VADLVDEFAGTGGKVAGGDEDAFVGFVRGEGADEFAERTDAHIAFPALRLHIEGIQAEAAFTLITPSMPPSPEAVGRLFGSAYTNKNGLTLSVSR